MKLKIRKLGQYRSGVTLVELMIVLGVIAFLAVLVSSYLRTQTFKANDARRKAEIKRIAVAVEEYEKDNNCYPLPSLVSCNPGTGLRPYIDKIPCDVVTGASYFYEHEDDVCPSWFKIYADLDNEKDTDYLELIGPNGAFSYVYESPNSPTTISYQQEEVPSGTSAPAPEIPVTDYYGCINGSCVQVGWDNSRPGPVCDPHFQNSTCYGQCGNPANECKNWN